MKRYFVPAILMAVFFLAGRFWSELRVTATGQGSGGACAGNGDVNGDGKRDISDAVALLSWLFLGGKEPVACADGGGLTPEQAEILSHMSMVDLPDGQGGMVSTIRISRANVQIVNGMEGTGTKNGTGNLIVGYNELRNDAASPDVRTGSHNIVGGTGSNYTSYGGLVSGYKNSSDCEYGTAIGSPCGPEVPEGFTFLGMNEKGYPEYRHEQTGIVFVRLPGGKFNMGSPISEVGREDDEGPVHEVTLSPFLIAKYEVTQAQWTAVMGTNPSHFTGNDSRPVEMVSWDTIQIFEANTGLTLPTEAQWEYACRAGTTGRYAGTGNIDDMGWYSGNAGGTTHPVGQKQPNQFGLYDMHGNLWEWCEDVYDSAFYSKAAAAGPDPVSTSGSSVRVTRGGNWGYSASACRSADRRGLDSWWGDDGEGFRPVKPLK